MGSRKTLSLSLFSSFVCLIVLCADRNNGSDPNYWEIFAKNVTQQATNNLGSLDDSGTRITQQAHDSFRPVREMQSKLGLKNGNGGSKLAIFRDRRFVIDDGMFECYGNISIRDGSCSGSLRKFRFKDKKEYFCRLPIQVTVNNWYCISNSPVNLYFSEAYYQCISVDKGMVLWIMKKGYSVFCGRRRP